MFFVRLVFFVFWLLLPASISLANSEKNQCPDLLSELSPPARNRELAKEFERAKTQRPLNPPFNFIAPVVTPLTSFYLEDVESLGDFDRLAREVRSGGGDQKVVKIVYQRDPSGTSHLYFLDTKKFQYHFEFAHSVLRYRDSVDQFNKNYEGLGKERAYNLASLVLRKKTGKGGADQILLELWSGDTLSPSYLNELLKEVKKHLKLHAELVFHPLGSEQEETVKSEHLLTPVITTLELYRDRNYLTLNEGVAFGYIKFVSPEDEEPLLDLTHIAVFDRVPNDIGLVGGVITDEFQTPLSHVNVKSMNRGTVNIALKNAKAILAPYVGKPVKLKVGPNGYTIELLPRTSADKLIADFWSTRKPKATAKIRSIITPELQGKFLDLSRYYFRLPSRDEHQRLIQTVGAKAANLALLNLITRSTLVNEVSSPETVGVPFNFYDDFMKSLGGEIKNILNDAELLDTTRAHSIEKVRPALEKIRQLILRADVSESLLQLFKKYLYEDKTSPLYFTRQPKLLLRSSTNSEDLEGFSGAGLYNSTGVALYTTSASGALVPRDWREVKQDLAQAIRYVYSSVWNERAFLEREWFSMNGKTHLEVKAGIAVHGGFNGTVGEGEVSESANGVAITANIFDVNDRDKIYLNSQHFGLSVTNPPSDVELRATGQETGSSYSTEELLVTNFVATPTEDESQAWKNWPFERLSRSSVNEGRSVFKSDEETRRLAKTLRIISDLMAKVYGKAPEHFSVDAEWNIFGQNRTLSINQVRPFSPSAPTRE